MEVLEGGRWKSVRCGGVERGKDWKWKRKVFLILLLGESQACGARTESEGGKVRVRHWMKREMMDDGRGW